MAETLDQLEAELRAALDAGDTGRCLVIAGEIDQYQTGPTASILASALWYAEQGLPVFPLYPNSKIPHRGTRGCKDATTDEVTIRAWWERWPESNVGIATGHVVDVVDIDGELGQTSRAKNWNLFSSLNVLGTVLTPRPGGMHLYVPATNLGNKAALLPGVDYRSTGGYVVAPPSHTEQGSYRWLRPLDTTDGTAA